MTCQLPNLTTLTLNGNRLMPLLKTPSPDLFLNAFPCLKKLALNSTGANLEQIGLIKSYLVHLTDLHIASNKIASIGNGGANFFEGWPSLQLLDLSDNALSSWEEVLELAAFPRLQRLILSSNRLPSISFPADRPGILPELRLLAVANNKLADWASMEALSSLPALGELRVQGNAICETMGTTALRQMLVARLPALVLVNGGEVRARDRMEAEKFYVRYRLTHAEGKTAEELSLSDALFAKLVEVLSPRLAALVPCYVCREVAACCGALFIECVGLRGARAQQDVGMWIVQRKGHMHASQLIDKKHEIRRFAQHPRCCTICAISKLTMLGALSSEARRRSGARGNNGRRRREHVDGDAQVDGGGVEPQEGSDATLAREHVCGCGQAHVQAGAPRLFRCLHA